MRAAGNGRTSTMRPTRTSTFRKSSKVMGGVSGIKARLDETLRIKSAREALIERVRLERFLALVRYH